ncbi:MAG: hypothetical protein IKU53_04760 [Firmicutes bacterium]|nr:hypothetical protein [Bacillota bacterium]
MKNRISRILLLIICVIVIVPQSVQAETFKPINTDVSIELDTSRWYTFSPENIEGNEELTYLGIDHQQMAQYMDEQNIHLYNIIYFGDFEHYMELLLKKTVNEGINNINNFDRKEILEIAKTIAKERGLSEYVMYEDGNKYVVFDYEEEGLYCKDYVTIINGCNYTITVRNPAPFIENDMGIIENVIKTVTFKIDPTKAAEIEEEKELPKLSLGTIITFLVLMAVLICAVLSFVKWKKKIRFENEMSELYETISVNSRNKVFAGGKKEFYFVGTMLMNLFPQGDLKELFIKYVNLHKTYTSYGNDVYKSYQYAKKTFKDLEEEDIYA